VTVARWQGTTTQRGLGYTHQAHKKKLLAALRPGQPCPRCGEPMWPHQPLDRDHTTPRALGGKDSRGVLSHAHCNRSAGARLGNRLRGLRGQQQPRRAWQPGPSRQW